MSHAGGDEQGGEPPCMLELVCEECGRLNEDPARAVCDGCGRPVRGRAAGTGP